MAHTELDLHERRIIEDMLNAKFSISKIAAELGRHRSTVYRDIKRNFYTDGELPNLSGYYGVIAQRKAEARRARRRKLIRIAVLTRRLSGKMMRTTTRFHGNDTRIKLKDDQPAYPFERDDAVAPFPPRRPRQCCKHSSQGRSQQLQFP